MADMDRTDAAFSAQVEQHCRAVEAADNNVSQDAEEEARIGAAIVAPPSGPGGEQEQSAAAAAPANSQDGEQATAMPLFLVALAVSATGFGAGICSGRSGAITPNQRCCAKGPNGTYTPITSCDACLNKGCTFFKTGHDDSDAVCASSCMIADGPPCVNEQKGEAVATTCGRYIDDIDNSQTCYSQGGANCTACTGAKLINTYNKVPKTCRFLSTSWAPEGICQLQCSQMGCGVTTCNENSVAEKHEPEFVY